MMVRPSALVGTRSPIPSSPGACSMVAPTNPLGIVGKRSLVWSASSMTMMSSSAATPRIFQCVLFVVESPHLDSVRLSFLKPGPLTIRDPYLDCACSWSTSVLCASILTGWGTVSIPMGESDSLYFKMHAVCPRHPVHGVVMPGMPKDGHISGSGILVSKFQHLFGIRLDFSEAIQIVAALRVQPCHSVPGVDHSRDVAAACERFTAGLTENPV